MYLSEIQLNQINEEEYRIMEGRSRISNKRNSIYYFFKISEPMIFSNFEDLIKHLILDRYKRSSETTFLHGASVKLGEIPFYVNREDLESISTVQLDKANTIELKLRKEESMPGWAFLRFGKVKGRVISQYISLPFDHKKIFYMNFNRQSLEEIDRKVKVGQINFSNIICKAAWSPRGYVSMVKASAQDLLSQ
ncbi:hypothetical protein HYX15_00735 [Candidatus Woesearchaeota archaeon]|nr:hypothetical protein [Candidatus Woesearchaeota archaeon]